MIIREGRLLLLTVYRWLDTAEDDGSVERRLHTSTKGNLILSPAPRGTPAPAPRSGKVALSNDHVRVSVCLSVASACVLLPGASRHCTCDCETADSPFADADPQALF